MPKAAASCYWGREICGLVAGTLIHCLIGCGSSLDTSIAAPPPVPATASQAPPPQTTEAVVIDLEKTALPPSKPTVEEAQSAAKLGNWSLNAAIFAPDAKIIFGCDYSNGVVLFDAVSFAPKGKWKWEGADFEEMILSADGGTLVSLDTKNVIRVWDTKTGKVRAVYEEHKERPNTIAIAPDGAVVVSSDTQPERFAKNLRSQYIAWDGTTATELWRKETRWRSPKPADFSPDGKLVALLGDHSVVLCDPRTGKEVGRYSFRQDVLNHFRFSPNSQKLAVAGEAGQGPHPVAHLALLDMASMKPDWVANLGARDFDFACFSPDGSKLVVKIGKDFDLEGKDILVLNVADGKPLFVLKNPHIWMGPMSISRDGKLLACRVGSELMLLKMPDLHAVH